jgi:hypothetical protein
MDLKNSKTLVYQFANHPNSETEKALAKPVQQAVPLATAQTNVLLVAISTN